MSLHALAGHMAAKGRGPDSMLVHMTPDEVQSLQTMARAQGGEVTINPETGLPEAGFLSDTLKALAPMALGAFLGPAGAAIGGGFMSAGMAGLTVGGLTSLATGSLSRGLMAGMGAYGGAGLGESIMNAGTGAMAASDIAAQQAAGSFPTLAEGATQEQIAKYATDVGALRDSALSKAGEAGIGARLSAGAGQMASNPGAYAGDFMKYGLAAISPIMAAEGVQTATPRQDTGYIRQKKFNPYTQQYVDLEPVKASEWGGRKFSDYADGGIVALAEGGGLSIADMYKQYAGREADPGGAQYWAEKFGSSVDPTEAAAFQAAIAEARTQGSEPMMAQAAAENAVQNMYRNVLNRDVEQSGLDYWTQQMQQASDPAQVYQAFLSGAQANRELGNFDTGYAQATTPYTGYMSSDVGSNADEWVRNVLGREVTNADRNQPWYRQMQTVNTPQEAEQVYQSFLQSTGAKTDLDLMAASQLSPLTKAKTTTPQLTGLGEMITTPRTYAPEGTSNPYGNGVTPGDITRNPDGSTTVHPNIPGRPYGGFTGIQQVKDAYTAGGGSLGQSNLFVPKAIEDMYSRYGNTGGSQQAYDYLMGKGSVDIKKPITKTGELMLPYSEAVLGMPASTAAAPATQKYVFDRKTRQYVLNPAYIDPNAPKEEVKKEPVVANTLLATEAANGGIMRMALGGLSALAGGGQAQYNLGGYSDGGRLLRGPGDGVSDSIPATIGDKQPARLADGEFVVPARIVSELGNGSTEAGARKLYAMMDRVQKARGKTTGKNRVAANTRADKYLPA